MHLCTGKDLCDGNSKEEMRNVKLSNFFVFSYDERKHEQDFNHTSSSKTLLQETAKYIDKKKTDEAQECFS